MCPTIRGPLTLIEFVVGCATRHHSLVGVMGCRHREPRHDRRATALVTSGKNILPGGERGAITAKGHREGYIFPALKDGPAQGRFSSVPELKIITRRSKSSVIDRHGGLMGGEHKSDRFVGAGQGRGRGEVRGVLVCDGEGMA